MTLRTISSEQARTEWRTLLDLASQGGVDIVIERHGKATAAVISYETYRALQPALAELRTGISTQQQAQRLAAILEKLAQLQERTTVVDPSAWQRQQRQDRSLTGRDS
ncbi:MAG: type II toxin-antitoxin system Phd/YefM family antitoxin [Anaerolineae bacterium]|nr:type II toxin-antitoxin system Phd/YefM family antitoxin [Anaerolineae bacterium]